MANPHAPRPSSPHDLVVAIDRDAAGIIRCDGTLCAPLARLPHGRIGRILSRVLARLFGAARPARVLLTVLEGAPYPSAVDPVVSAVESACDAWRVPLVWLPDVQAALDALRELGLRCDTRDSPPPTH